MVAAATVADAEGDGAAAVHDDVDDDDEQEEQDRAPCRGAADAI